MTMYEQRAVLYLDILGFRELISRGQEEKILKVLTGFKRRVESMNGNSETGAIFTAFSDCIVLSRPLSDDRSGAATIVALGQFLALELLADGMLSRGGMSVGNLYHVGQTIFGPALVEAYELESRHARYPRILATAQFRQDLMAWHEKIGAHSQAKQFDIAKEEFFLRRDFDGMYHLNIFSPLVPAPKAYHGSSKQTGATLGTYGPQVIEFVLKAYSDHYNEAVAPKYNWLVNYLREACYKWNWPTDWGITNST